jgi:hypothetical protein
MPITAPPLDAETNCEQRQRTDEQGVPRDDTRPDPRLERTAAATRVAEATSQVHSDRNGENGYERRCGERSRPREDVSQKQKPEDDLRERDGSAGGARGTAGQKLVPKDSCREAVKAVPQFQEAGRKKKGPGTKPDRCANHFIHEGAGLRACERRRIPRIDHSRVAMRACLRDAIARR